MGQPSDPGGGPESDPVLHESLVPLRFLLGRWRGSGVVGYPTIASVRFGQEISFSHNGKPYLIYTSRTWLLAGEPDGPGSEVAESATGGADVDGERPGRDASSAEPHGETADPDGAPAAGTPGRPLAMEAGFWRPQPGGQLEVLLAHPTGITEIYLGTFSGTRIELATDLVARTATAKEVTAGRRLYGLIGADLGWAYDMAAVGQPLQPHASARLTRVG
jgi:THAP4-like, heme-binding beta-barrel domain